MQGGAGGQARSWQGGRAERNRAGPSLPSLWPGPLKPYIGPSKGFGVREALVSGSVGI